MRMGIFDWLVFVRGNIIIRLSKFDSTCEFGAHTSLQSP
jgi:hypothetical protein